MTLGGGGQGVGGLDVILSNYMFAYDHLVQFGLGFAGEAKRKIPFHIPRIHINVCCSEIGLQ